MLKKFLYFFPIFISITVLAKPVHRIISLAPNITEIVFAVGAGKYVIGTSSATDYPPKAAKISVVATSSDLDMERIVKLHPDLVIAWKEGNPLTQIKQLKILHIPVYIASFKTISDIPKVALKIGKLAGTEKYAKRFVKKFKKHYQKIRDTYRHFPAISVFYQLALRPLMTLNNNSPAGQIMKLCGAKNIFGNTITVAPQIGVENVLARNPDVILISSINDVEQHNNYKFWKRFPQINAVKNRHIYNVNASLTERYSPRILEGADRVCKLIHS